MKIAIGSDHAGFDYKSRLLSLLAYLGHDALDYGTYSDAATDYPRWIRPVAEAVASGDVDRGIVLGGSGNGEAIVANRVPGVRCTLCWNAQSARYGRQHNDSNVLSIGQRMVSWETAREIVDAWLTTRLRGRRGTSGASTRSTPRTDPFRLKPFIRAFQIAPLRIAPGPGARLMGRCGTNGWPPRPLLGAGRPARVLKNVGQRHRQAGQQRCSQRGPRRQA